MRQREQRRGGEVGPNVGRGGGRSKGRGRGIVEAFDQKIVWIVLAGFVECLLRHSIELLHNAATSDSFQITALSLIGLSLKQIRYSWYSNLMCWWWEGGRP